MIPEKPTDYVLFKPFWKDEFKWLKCEFIFNADLKIWSETIFCTYCQEYYSYLKEQSKNNQTNCIPETNSLIVGSNSFNKTRLQEHLKSKNQFHFNAERFFLSKGSQKKPNELIKEGYNNLFSNQKLKVSDLLLQPLFYASYFIAKEDISIIKYENLKVLLNILEVDLSQSYGSRKFCNEFLDCIYEVLLEELSEQIKSNNYISLSLDSTSLQYQKKEVLAITIRYLDKDYNLQEKFYYVLNTDGARVLSSQQNGLAGQLIAKIPYLITTQCVAHKASLGIKDLAKKFQYIKDLNYYSYTLASFLNTKKRLDLLSENEMNLLYGDDHSILTLIQPIDVRWISYFPSIQRIVHLLLPILETLIQIKEENDTPNLRQLIDFFVSLENVLLIATYGDILQPVYQLTKQLQKNTLTLLTLECDIDYCLQQLMELKENDGDLIKSLYQRIYYSEQKQIILDDYHIMILEEDLFQVLDKVQTKKMEIINFLISNLQQRFLFSEIVKQYQAFNINLIRKQNESNLQDFGLDNVKSLLQFYKQNHFKGFQDYEQEKIIEQYQYSKQKIHQYQQVEINLILQMLDSSEFLKQISQFYKLYLILPLSSVECERVFSQVLNIVTKRRNHLAINTIDSLLFISRNGPSLNDIKQINITKAIILWKENKVRKKI